MTPVLLISCYELGRPPSGLAVPLAFLRRAGRPAETLDLSVEPFDEEKARRAAAAVISVPMHTALRMGVRAAERIRRINPDCRIFYYGLYALLNSDYLLRGGADGVVGGECEEDLIRVLDGGTPGSPLQRLDFPVPARDGLPGLDRYARLEEGGTTRLAGSVEASRGCRHLCTHCPIPPVYGGRFFVVPQEVVLEDIRTQVRAGATHISFADPDFLNGPGHSMSVARAMHAEFPDVTFDFTAKVEHILKRRSLFPELAALGCNFMISAVESLSDTVLANLEKGHTGRDVRVALSIVRDAGIAMRPTFVPFTPWTTRDDYHEILRFLDEESMVDHVDPVQLSIRLLVPPGSLLLQSPAMRPHLGDLIEEKLIYPWTHPDPSMDALQRDVARVVERDPNDSFEEICALAGVEPSGRPRAGARPPRMTESWFC